MEIEISRCEDRKICCTKGGKQSIARPAKNGKSYHVFADAVVIVDAATLEFTLSPIRNRVPQIILPPCPHLGPAIEKNGATILVKCGCSGKEREQFHAAHKCEIHKRCLPTFRPTPEQLEKFAEGIESDVQLFRWCHGCESRPTTQRAT